ncbi:MAG TPA: hypothetical protein DCY86_09290 [Bdellovibrionales bacterium]|nr:hypothetical protein [Bdellovibrionales bacterium]
METFIHLTDLLDLEKSDQATYRKDFDCQEPSLNDYLHKHARKQSEGDISQTHVLFDHDKKKIISYYSTCNYSVQKESVASKFGIPVKQVPATLIGRLAVDKTYKGQGYGAITLVQALKQIRTMSKISAIKIVVVDALNASAVSFYKNFGFIEFDDDPMRLFINTVMIDDL